METSKEVLAIGDRRTNAKVMADCMTLGYLPDPVLDCTYGFGRFWNDVRPSSLVTADISAALPNVDVVCDFRSMPFADRSFATVVYDPPYKFCLDTDTTILTRRGWLASDEVVVGDMAYSLNMSTGLGEWKQVLGVHVYPKEPTEVAVCDGSNLHFIATAHHRWPVVSAQTGGRVWKTTETMKANDRIIHAATWAGRPTEKTHSDEWVELVAWFWTEGYIDAPSTYGTITQSHVVNAENCARIERCFVETFGPPVEKFARLGRRDNGDVPELWRIHGEPRNVKFIFSSSIGAKLLKCAPNKTPSLEFIESLTADQLELFIETSLTADGQNKHVLAQIDPSRSEAFALACILSGRAVTSKWYDGNGQTVTVKKRHFSKPHSNGFRYEKRDLAVWCPTIADNETWLARKDGRIFFTGNSGTNHNSGPATSNASYGINEYSSVEDRMSLIVDGALEAARVAAQMVLVKCQDQVVSGSVYWQTRIVSDCMERVGFRLIDELHVVGYRKQPPGRRQLHARRDYSTLLVFERSERRRVVSPSELLFFNDCRWCNKRGTGSRSRLLCLGWKSWPGSLLPVLVCPACINRQEENDDADN